MCKNYFTTVQFMDLFSDVQWDMIKMIDGDYKPFNCLYK